MTYFQTTVPTPDDVVAVSNLLDQMTSLLEMEQTMLDNFQGQDDEDLDGGERIGMNPLQQVRQTVKILEISLSIVSTAIFYPTFILCVLF